MSDTLSLSEARHRLRAVGKTTVDLARELGVSKGTVRGVLGGRFKGDRGDAHKVAVALGLKIGSVIQDNQPIADAIRAAGR